MAKLRGAVTHRDMWPEAMGNKWRRLAIGCLPVPNKRTCCAYAADATARALAERGLTAVRSRGNIDGTADVVGSGLGRDGGRILPSGGSDGQVRSTQWRK